LREKRIEIFAVVSVGYANLVVGIQAYDVGVGVIGGGNHSYSEVLVHVDWEHKVG
jgi:hypothetical protein